MVEIHPTAIIYDNVTILGDNVYIGPYCIIGAPAESRSEWGNPGCGVIIAENVILHGHNTIDAGTKINTMIGNNTFIMKGVHIGHDAQIMEGVTIAPHAVIGGHAIIRERTNMGMGAIIHQRCQVPKDCMIGMGTIITKKTDLKANGVYVGSPAKWIRENNWKK